MPDFMHTFLHPNIDHYLHEHKLMEKQKMNKL